MKLNPTSLDTLCGALTYAMGIEAPGRHSTGSTHVCTNHMLSEAENSVKTSHQSNFILKLKYHKFNKMSTDISLKTD